MNLWLIRNRERIAAAVAATSWAAPVTALAALNPVSTPDAVNKTGFKSIEDTIPRIFNIIVTVAGVAFVVLFLLGGIQYLGGAGNDEVTKKARQLMLDAVIGLAIVVVAWAVGTYVLSLLGLGTGSNLNTRPSEIK